MSKNVQAECILYRKSLVEVKTAFSQWSLWECSSHAASQLCM